MARFNIFEGARRIARLLQLLWLLVIGLVAYSESPYVTASFNTLSPTSPFVSTTGDCKTTSARKSVTRSVGDGRTINITLCFESQAFDDGRELVLYRAEGTTAWGQESYTPDVQ